MSQHGSPRPLDNNNRTGPRGDKMQLVANAPIPDCRLRAELQNADCSEATRGCPRKTPQMLDTCVKIKWGQRRYLMQTKFCMYLIENILCKKM